MPLLRNPRGRGLFPSAERTDPSWRRLSKNAVHPIRESLMISAWMEAPKMILKRVKVAYFFPGVDKRGKSFRNSDQATDTESILS
jgi:hypothetical protein